MSDKQKDFGQRIPLPKNEVSKLADECGLHRSTLSRRWRQNDAAVVSAVMRRQVDLGILPVNIMKELMIKAAGERG